MARGQYFRAAPRGLVQVPSFQYPEQRYQVWLEAKHLAIWKGAPIKPVGKRAFLICTLILLMSVAIPSDGTELIEISFPGRVINDIAVDPALPEHGWAISEGVLLETTDGFSSLHPVESLRNKNFMFVQTVPDSQVTVFAGGKDGLWKSSAKGNDWRLVLKRPVSVIARGKDGNLWVAGDEKGMFDPYLRWYLYYSTDLGLHWRQIYKSVPEHDFTGGLAVDSKDPRRLWSGGYYGLFKSENGGLGWEQMDSNERIHSLIFAPAKGELFLGYGNTGIARLIGSKIEHTALTDEWIVEMAFLNQDRLVALGIGKDSLYIVDTVNNTCQQVVAFKRAVTSFALVPIHGGVEAVVGGNEAVWRVKLMGNKPTATSQNKPLSAGKTYRNIGAWLLVVLTVAVLGGLGRKFLRR
ncbi:MAG: hypothetical protein AB1374_13290 [Bacillota bacterium]